MDDCAAHIEKQARVPVPLPARGTGAAVLFAATPVMVMLLFGAQATLATEPPALQRQTAWLSSADAAAAVAGAKSTSSAPLSMAALLSGLTTDSTLELVPVVEAAHRNSSALRVHRHQQNLDGRAVFGATAAVLVDARAQPIALVSALAEAEAQSRWLPELAPTDAIRPAIAAQLRLNPSALTVTASSDGVGDGEHTYYELSSSNPGLRSLMPLRVREVWYPSAQGLTPAYQVELMAHVAGRLAPEARTLIVSAQDARILRSNNHIHDLRPRPRPGTCGSDCAPSGVRYRVMADRRGVPYTDPYGFTSPHPTGERDGSLPQQPAPMRMLRLDHAGISTGDPWLPDDAVETRGNNVDSFFRGLPVVGDRYPTNVFDGWTNDLNPAVGDFRAVMNIERGFDFVYDVELAADDYAQRPGALAIPIPTDSEQLNAKIVQGFYVGNWLHDLFYDLGFDEAAGNMQSDNFGRGGLDGDPLIVHSGHAVGSAFAFAPGDGISPVLSLGQNGFSLSNRDVAGFDFGVFIHEWTHTMFARLTQMAYQGQSGAINEGTADFVSMFLMVEPSHRNAAPGTGDFHGAYPVGAYWNLDYSFPGDGLPPAGAPGYPDNTYYHGVRRFPFSASLAINPVTFAHISAENPLPDGFEPFDWKLRSFTPHEIHTAGEIWASALWQCARNILVETNARGFEARHRQFLAELVAALKLFPIDATYTEARDAMLMAVRAGSEQDYRRCRAGFAVRGLGAGAVAPPRDSLQFFGVVESFVDEDPPGLR